MRVSKAKSILSKEIKFGTRQALSKGADAVLKAFRDVYPRAITIDQAAVMAGRSLKSSAYPGIRKEVLCLVGDVLTVVSADIYKLSDQRAGSRSVSVKTHQELISLWASKFSPAVGKMLHVLFDNKQFSSKERWAEASRVSPTSSTVGKAVKELRVNGLLITNGDQILIHENFREDI